MDKSFNEKVLSTFWEPAKKHKYLIPFMLLMLLCAAVILFIYSIFAYLASNGKRFASLIVVLMFFTVSSSFSFPVFSEGLGGQTEESENAVQEVMQETTQEYDSKLMLANEDSIHPEDVKILDDDDVLDGYEDAELHGMEDADKYTLDEILEGNIQYSGSTHASESAGEEVVFDKDDWRLVLINKQHPIPADYTFTLGVIKGSMKCDERIIGDLLAMFQAAKEDGINLVVCSPYRDMSRQEMLFDRKIKKYMDKGMSYMEAYSYASQAVTVPGASEHQIGLAIDIVCDTYKELEEGFADTEAGKWLAEHSCEYGFILRYPLGKEYITGIEFEPWHFRYVGVDAAMAITGQGLCLEEFIEGL